jgi:hypothetical protein
MQDLVRDLIPWVFIAGLLGCVIIPFWFLGSILRVAFSEAPLARLRQRWPVLLIFGAATVFILYAFDLFPPRHEIPFPYDSPSPPTTAEAIENADAIVEGSFLLDRSSSSRAVFTKTYYPNLKANTFVIPFQIERSVRGPSSGMVNVKLFFTLWANTPFYEGLPLHEKLLLLLKRDPNDSQNYILVSQNTCWLVLYHPHTPEAAPADPAKFILDDVKGFLNACLDQPGKTAAIAYMKEPTTLGAFSSAFGGGRVSTIIYPQNDPARAQALRIGKDLGTSDPEFLAIAKKYEDGPWQIGEIARSIRTASGDYSAFQSRLAANTAAPPAAPSPGFHILDERNNLPGELSNAIRDSTHPADLLPLVNQAMASPDPRTREFVMRALDQYEMKDGYGQYGDRLGSVYFPLIIKMLDDSDPEVRSAALGCTFCISGSVKQRVPDREVNMPATFLFKQDPDLYVNKAKTWWQTHHPELTTSPGTGP